jgi:pimeloyl-[acyl-carrier protein] methyl ester esterase
VEDTNNIVETDAYGIDQGSGPVLLLVHGWAIHSAFFAPQLQQLSGRFRIVAPDLAGHGRVRQAPGPFTITRLADDLAALIAERQLSDIVAVGWSMGAMILWDLLLRHGGERFSGLVVEDMSPCILNRPGWNLGLSGGYDEETDARTQAAMRRDWPGYVTQFAPRICARGLGTERRAIVDWAAEEMQANGPETMAALWASMAAQDFRETLRRIETPSLILHGRLSQLYPPETAQFVTARMADARRIEFAHAGHAPHLEEPARFNQIVEDFAAQIGGTKKRQAAIPGGTRRFSDHQNPTGSTPCIRGTKG